MIDVEDDIIEVYRACDRVVVFFMMEFGAYIKRCIKHIKLCFTLYVINNISQKVYSVTQTPWGFS